MVAREVSDHELAPADDAETDSVTAGGGHRALTAEDDGATMEPAVAAAAGSTVRVAVRVRPLLAMEDGTDLCLRVLRGGPTDAGVPPQQSLQVTGGGPQFTYDQVFDLTSTQAQVYQACVAPLVESCLEGYNATIFAYGQTGSGKTYTIMGQDGTEVVAASGDAGDGSPPHCDDHAGVIPRALQALFERLPGEDPGGTSTSSVTAAVRVQFLEVYGEEIRDLLTNNHGVRLSVRDVGPDGEPEVLGATQKPVVSAAEALRALAHGRLRRVTGATAMNEASSRSHAILSVLVEQTVVLEAGGDGGDDASSSSGEEHVQIKRSRFNFVDLAGSERQKRTQAEGKRLKEGIEINKGLLVLGNVISALGDPAKQGKTHVPYRDSKLTRLLKGSLGGNHKTLMIACVSPSSANLDETLNCLRYANRAKNIQNHAVVNLDASSKLVAELQSHVQVLAGELLRCWDEDKAEPKFTRDELTAMTTGASMGTISGITSSSIKAFLPSHGVSGSVPSNDAPKLKEMEMELDRTREQLRETRSNHDTAEEQLYVAKAQSELYKLQLSVLSKDESISSSIEHDLFLEKAKEYEKEIGQLRTALQAAESKANRMAWATMDDLKKPVIEKALAALDADRERLASLQAAISWEGENALTSTNDSLHAAMSDSCIDHDDMEEQAKLQRLTNKYINDDEEDDNSSETNNSTSAMTEERNPVSESPVQRQRLLETGLDELSRSIAAKEELIEQLRLSHEKYAGMRDFYDERLRQMEIALSEKEAEREKLLVELERTKEGHRSHSNLKNQLLEKESHIADLKKKQKDLRNLTAISSRNLSDINRLQTEVSTMKRKKVEMQKQLAEDRKLFASEKKRFQKDALQKEKELNKWKQVSNQREIEAQKAQQVAKARLQELGHLRSKYKDAEKKVRVLSLKKGVMAKAGLDPVLVGRRDKQVTDMVARTQNIDVDRLRDHFDQKVASIVRKEAIVEKLAEEWEEHFELTNRREEMISVYGEGADEVDTLSIQIKFKESRIRQLAQRLGRDQRPPPETKELSDKKINSFVFDTDLTKICGGAIDDSTKSMIACVLFGMVVRERRRVSALARTASSLDERAQNAENAAAQNEKALQSYMEEQRQEIAALTQSQREQIISLMGLVKESSQGEGLPSGFSECVGPNVLLLANEQISLLEQQIEELRSENQSLDTYRSQLEEFKTAVESRSKEIEEKEDELALFRSVLRQIRELIVGQLMENGEGTTGRTICDLVDDILHNRNLSPGKITRRPTSSGRDTRRMFSPRLKKHIELMHTSDSDGGSEAVDWSSEIMADLAIIAEGHAPASIKDTSLVEGMITPRRSATSQATPSTRTTSTKNASSHHGAKGRRVLTKQVAEKLGKIVIPDVKTSTDENRKPPKNPHSKHKSVFDRLGSPSHYTMSRSSQLAPQKERERASKLLDNLLVSNSDTHHEHHTPHSSNYGRIDTRDAATRLLDDLLVSDSDAGNSESERDTPKSVGDMETSEKFASYTQQDVFERLQKTTTQAYAVKQLEAVAYDCENKDHSSRNACKDTVKEKESSSHVVAHSTAGPVTFSSGYVDQDVFERLQTTTTEAFAKKKHPPVK